MSATQHRKAIPVTLQASIIALVMILAVDSSAFAQDFNAKIVRAQKTLAQIDRLIAGIQGRQSLAQVGPGPAAFSAANDGAWKNLFDGNSLSGWKVTNFGGGGEVHIEKPFRGGPPAIVVDMGATLSGFNWTGDVPRTDYEIYLEALKVDGSDFLCGLTFPVAKSYASLILGGWGGGVIGISSINHLDASENDTTRYFGFVKDHWYRIRLRVTPSKLEAWLDDRVIVNQDITGKFIDLRPGDISRSIPLGIATFQTTAAYRNIRIRQLAAH